MFIATWMVTSLKLPLPETNTEKVHTHIYIYNIHVSFSQTRVSEKIRNTLIFSVREDSKKPRTMIVSKGEGGKMEKKTVSALLITFPAYHPL